MHLRPALPEDIPELMAVERSAAQAFASLPELAWLAAGDVLDDASHQAFIAAGGSWLVAEGRRVLGFVCVSLEGQALHIHELSVRLDAQGQGIGRRLLDHVRDEAWQRGASQLTLTTFANVPWNAPFYSRYGFETLGPALIDARLQALLATEARQGLTKRCAMRYLNGHRS